MTTAAAHALLESLVDYAGLFPPAALKMEKAVAEYRRWRRSPQAWMLGRFVVPAARLEELGAALSDEADEWWRLSALVGADSRGDLARICSFNAGARSRACVDTVELKAETAADTGTALQGVPSALVSYVELPVAVRGQVSPAEVGGDGRAKPASELSGVRPDPDLPDLLQTLHALGARAKIRTGGVVPGAIPSAAAVAGFLAGCAALDLPFKATAGLHHAIRSEQPLTYEPEAPRAVVHGFLNLFAAAVFARAGASAAELERVLEERDPAIFRLEDDGLLWRGRRALPEDVALCRATFAVSFGSCSFAEPVDELRALGLLP